MAQQPDLSPGLEIDTPYLRARKEWDSRIGDARVQAKNWRMVCLASNVLNLILAVGLLFFASKVKIIPYVIEVAEPGQVRSVGKINTVAYEPREVSIKFYIGEWLHNVRSLSNDPVVVKRNWERAYAYVTTKAANTLSAYAREVDPFSRVGKFTVSVEIEHILMLSERSVEIQWNETIHNDQGTPLTNERYSGIFNIVIRMPDNEAILDVNPLGVFIDTFNWTAKRV